MVAGGAERAAIHPGQFCLYYRGRPGGGWRSRHDAARARASGDPPGVLRRLEEEEVMAGFRRALSIVVLLAALAFSAALPAQAVPVDLELVLAVDCSGSVDES